MAQVETKPPVVTIKAIGFDLGGVILGSERQIFYRYCQEAFEVAIDQHLSQLERGDIAIDEFWQRVTASLGVDYQPEIDRQLWRKNFIHNTPVRSELIELTDRLRANGYKTAILSNTHAEHVDINSHRHIFDHFDEALMSNQIGATKPEAKAYLSLCRRLGVLPSQVVFIDDLAVNVAGAEAVGMKAIEFHGYEDLVKRLELLNVKTD